MALDTNSKKWLKGRFKNHVQFDEPMAGHTYLKVGGPADAYVEIETLEELAALTEWIRQNRVPLITVGDGSNLLVKDSGIRGVVIRMTKELKQIRAIDDESGRIIISAMAGSRMQALCRFSITNGFGGMNFATGIPGTVGGGIAMNAGTAMGSMGDVIESVRVLTPAGTIKNIGRAHMNFSYRHLEWDKEALQDNSDNLIIVEGLFLLYSADPKQLKEEAERLLASRNEKQPVEYPSAGCVFKNPGTGKSAGELIERAGMKGKTMGGARISEKHANFIINYDKATAADILALMDMAQENVYRMFNIHLEPEVKIVG